MLLCHFLNKTFIKLFLFTALSYNCTFVMTSPEKMLLTIHKTIEAMRVETMGEETMRVEITAVEAIGVEIMETMKPEIEMIRFVICATEPTMWPRKVHMERSLCNISHARTL